MSAILIDNLPIWAELISTPGNEISLMDKWDEKIDAIIKGTLQEDVRSLAGVPSWMLTLMNKLLETTGKNYIDEIWQNLEVYFHGGVSFKPYRNEFNNIISNKDFKYYEVYNASEGFFGIQDSNDVRDLLLMLDYGIFYEFIEVSEMEKSEKIIDLSQVKIHKNVILEDLSETVNEKLIYSLLNIIDLENKYIIITSKVPIVNIKFTLNDLISRTKNFLLFDIHKPDDDLMFALILKNLSDRQITVDKKLINFIIKRIDRSYDKIFEFIYKVDELSLKKKNQLILES